MKYFSYILILLVFYPFIGCDNNFIEKNHIDADIIFHKSHEAKKKEAPFSDVVQVGNTFYLSGQIGINHKTRELVDGGIVVETTQTLENIKAVLNQHHLKMTDVIKVIVVLDEIEDFTIFNKIYETYFPQKPARTTFAAQALAKGAKIEIEVIAYKSKL